MGICSGGEVNNGLHRHIFQILLRSTIVDRAAALVHIVHIGVEVQGQARVNLFCTIAIDLHLMNGRASTIPARVTDGTCMVVVERAHTVVVINLIDLIIIRTHPDIFYRILVGHDEIVGIDRLQSIAK